MAKAKKVKQLTLSMEDRIGLLADITDALAEAKVNINAICAYGMENIASFMLYTDSPAKAKKALVKLGVPVKEEDVVAVDMPNRSGELRKAAQKIADAEVNIYYLYGTTGPGKSATCILKTSDDKKAITVTNKQR